MKTSIKANLVITSLMILCFVASSFSQMNKYRVTAYKKGNNKTTSTSNIVEVMPALDLYIPNAFTPNDDGLNDKFGAAGQGIVDYKLMIYNVWGNLVFETKTPSEQWDGKHNGLLCAEGAYTYVIVAKGEKSRVRKSGTVSLVM